MIKIISLVKRKPGITHEEFKTYYEENHVKVGYKYLQPYCVKYQRRYVTASIGHHTGGEAPPVDHDCLVEMWFPDEAALAAFRASVAPADAVSDIRSDEDEFVDGPATRRYRVEEFVSWDNSKES